MSLQNELDRLEALGRNPNVSSEQRQHARDAWEAINDGLILEAWNRIETRTSEYNALVSRLEAVVDNITANRLTGTMDGVTSIIEDLTAMVSES